MPTEICNGALGEVVPIPTLPLLNQLVPLPLTLNNSVPSCLRISKGALFESTPAVTTTPLEFPVFSNQPAQPAVERKLLIPPSFTSNFQEGVVVPIPTLLFVKMYIAALL